MQKSPGRRGSGPDPDRGDYDTPPDPLVDWEGEPPAHSLPARRRRHLDSRRLHKFSARVVRQILSRGYAHGKD